MSSTILYTVPRRSLVASDIVAIARGDWVAHYGWVLKELTQPGSNLDETQWLGGCLWCSLEATGDDFCKYRYIAEKGGQVDRYHIGVIWVQGDYSGHVLGPADQMTVGFYGYFGWYYRVPRGTVWEGCSADPCLEYPLSADIPDTEQFRTWPMSRYTMEQRPKSWFRQLWNSIFTYHQVAPDEPCPIEPGHDEYIFFYAIVDTPNQVVHHEHVGWASPFGSGCGHCPDGPGGSIILPCGDTYHVNVGSPQDAIIDPSYSYPCTVYREGSMVATIPGHQLYTYYNRNNPPWNGG